MVYSRSWYLANRERLIQKAREWRIKNRERFNEIARNSYHKNKSKITERNEGLRRKVYSLLGSSCYICLSTDTLQVHHLYYDQASIKGPSGRKWIKRLKEAIMYPERFIMLCGRCHSRIEQFKNKPADEQLRLIEALMETVRQR